MRNLLNFLIRYNYWFLFILLEVASFVLLFRFNQYQQSVFFTSANVISGGVYEISGGISSYFHLQSVNDDLLNRNMLLEQQNANLRKALNDIYVDSARVHSIQQSSNSGYQLYKAKVINNRLTQIDNYITLDKGSSDGLRSGMGVIDANGIVGIIYQTSSHYSVVISVLNSKFTIQSKILGSDYNGALKWNHGDPRFVSLQLPLHAAFQEGDTVVTSGYSSAFPEGVMVGTVEQSEVSADGKMVTVRLATDFGKLSNVRVIAREGQEELRELEQRAGINR